MNEWMKLVIKINSNIHKHSRYNLLFPTFILTEEIVLLPVFFPKKFSLDTRVKKFILWHVIFE